MEQHPRTPKDERSIVTADEDIFRRVPPVYHDPDGGFDCLAFRPTEDDSDGLSVYRQQCGVCSTDLAAVGRKPFECYVVSLRVEHVNAPPLGLSVTPDLQPGLLRGHALIPEVRHIARQPSEEKRRMKELQLKLANLANAEGQIMFRPIDPSAGL